MSACRIDFNETECIYFTTKEDFDKYIENWEKVINIIKKKIDSQLTYSKKYLIKLKKHKKSFQCFCRNVISVSPSPVIESHKIFLSPEKILVSHSYMAL